MSTISQIAPAVSPDNERWRREFTALAAFCQSLAENPPSPEATARFWEPLRRLDASLRDPEFRNRIAQELHELDAVLHSPASNHMRAEFQELARWQIRIVQVPDGQVPASTTSASPSPPTPPLVRPPLQDQMQNKYDSWVATCHPSPDEADDLAWGQPLGLGQKRMRALRKACPDPRLHKRGPK